MISIHKTMALIAGQALWLPGLFAAQPTVEDARKFLDDAEQRLLVLSNESSQANWVEENFITFDTEGLAARANQRATDEQVRLAKQSKRFDALALPPDMARKMHLLRIGFTLATPSDPKESEEVSRLAAELDGMYGKGKYCPQALEHADKKCLDIGDITRIMAASTNPAELLDAWKGWHRVSPPMRKDFARFVELSNQGARELGFRDTGAMWRSKYDMPPDDFAKEVDRLWAQVRPLYVSLHAYVRSRLREKYGAAVVPADGPIPAHLLGNIWAQDWSNVYPLVAPAGADPGYDLTAILKARKAQPADLVRYGESFFKSLGFAPLPPTFWERSLLVKPRDRDVVCHASAWDVDNAEDLRIKLCLDITAEDFTTVHHELGHNFYQRAYSHQPFLFRDSANDGVHEAIGDTIALSVTPEYLVKIGLLDRAPDASKDIGLLLARALEKVAFLPFGLLVDQWRWRVFSGEIPPEKYNQAWWDLRQKYQGVAPPVGRTELDFDPGAKYHVAGNVPYTRYFLSFIMQFQFHRALARAAGCPVAGSGTPLSRCSIYASREERGLDASAILDYFAPLRKWLDEQNKGKPVGW
jgi:peptidyl-dipeptidase A